MYRSRLQRIQEKRSLKRAAWIWVVLILLIVGGLIWGTTLLAKLAVFLGNIGSARKGVESSDAIPPAPPNMFVPFEATNSATISVKGWAEIGSVIYLTNNKQPEGQTVTGDDGMFVFGNIDLTTGKNELIAVAMDKAGNKSVESLPVRVDLINKLPSLDITTPTDGQTINGGDGIIEIKGKTEPSNKITVNDRVIVISGDGSFVTKVKLGTGDSSVKIVAGDKVGNQTTKEIKVTYNP